jgi:hypothetical protein
MTVWRGRGNWDRLSMALFSSMKMPRLLTILLLFSAACLFGPASFAEDKRNPDQTELGSRMEQINTAWRRLRRQVNDSGQNTASIALIAKIREAAKGTEQMSPVKALEIPEAKRAQFQADYAAAMEKFFSQIDKLEQALKVGDNVAAGKIVVAISDFQREAHKEFRKEQDHK